MALRSASGSGMGSGDGVAVSVLMVRQRFLNYCFRWPFFIAVEKGRCLEMSSYDSPGQVVR